jgi:hypothetical protein
MSNPSTGEAAMFLLFSFVFLMWMFRRKHKTGLIEDQQATVDSDKRTQAQQKLRRDARLLKDIIFLLIGALIGLFITLYL